MQTSGPMLPRRRLSILVVAAALVAVGGAEATFRLSAASARALSDERRPIEIPLSGPLADPAAEISGLAWHGDRLVLLPQYPKRMGAGTGDGVVFTLAREEVLAFLDGRRDGPLSPRAVPLDAPDLERLVPGFEGLEAIGFRGDEVYVTVEAEEGARVEGLLLRGRTTPELGAIALDTSRSALLEPQAAIANFAYEALVVARDRVLAFYEANGASNRRPRAKAFDAALAPRGELPIDPLEYRMTDASELDRDGRFWALNYYWPGEEWRPGLCALTARFGRGATHARTRVVERLVEMRYTGRDVRLTGRPPIQLELEDEADGRNWEGVARLPGRGLLIVTDEHPRSMLAFVADR